MLSLSSALRLTTLFGIGMVSCSIFSNARGEQVGRGQLASSPSPSLIAKENAAAPAAATARELRDLPEVIRGMIRDGKGVRFMDRFNAGGGMMGYVLSSSNGERRIFYVTPDSKFAILGLMFDQTLKNVTADHQATYIDVSEFLDPPRRAPTRPTLIDSAAAMTPMATEGEGLEVFLFADPLSAQGRQLFRATRQHLGSLKVQWIAASSSADVSHLVPVVATVLEAKDQAKALAEAFAGSTRKASPSPASLERAKRLLESAAHLRSEFAGLLPVALYRDVHNADQILTEPPSAARWASLASDGSRIRDAQRFKQQSVAR